MKEDSRINYVELPAEDFTKAKAFYGDVFGWTFQDYGDCYCAFNDGSMDGGFYRSPLQSDSSQGATLVVLYAEDLEATLERITAAGGELCKPMFSFPGGRRFHFLARISHRIGIWKGF
ncbi:MAG: VOC family protein [Candidatus Dadabacteria bacterium]|nr:VOC family protein [Candidatus Dadabacteria bacterium]